MAPRAEVAAFSISLGAAAVLGVAVPDLGGSPFSIFIFFVLAPVFMSLPLAAVSFSLGRSLKVWLAILLTLLAFVFHSAVHTSIYAYRIGTTHFDDMTYTMFMLEWLVKLGVLAVVFFAYWLLSIFLRRRRVDAL